jgi:hypothetical protein
LSYGGVNKVSWSFFDSESSADTRAAETGQQTTGATSPATSLSNLSFGKNSSIDLDLALSDFGAIDAAFEFAGGAGAAAAELQSDALGRMAANSASAIQSGEALSRAFVDNARESQSDAFEFAAGGVMSAFDAAENAQQAVDAIAARSLDSIAEAYGTAAEYSQASMILALDQADQAAQVQAAAFSKATGAIEDANKSETAKLSDQLVYGVLALVALLAWRASQ